MGRQSRHSSAPGAPSVTHGRRAASVVAAQRRGAPAAALRLVQHGGDVLAFVAVRRAHHRRADAARVALAVQVVQDDMLHPQRSASAACQKNGASWRCQGCLHKQGYPTYRAQPLADRWKFYSARGDASNGVFAMCTGHQADKVARSAGGQSSMNSDPQQHPAAVEARQSHRVLAEHSATSAAGAAAWPVAPLRSPPASAAACCSCVGMHHS